MTQLPTSGTQLSLVTQFTSGTHCSLVTQLSVGLDWFESWIAVLVWNPLEPFFTRVPSTSFTCSQVFSPILKSSFNFFHPSFTLPSKFNLRLPPWPGPAPTFKPLAFTSSEAFCILGHFAVAPVDLCFCWNWGEVLPKFLQIPVLHFAF